MSRWGSTSENVLVLPRNLSRAVRMPIGAGRKNFWICRGGDARHLLYEQKARVTGHILIVVTRGFLRLEIDNIPFTVKEGNAIFLSDLEYTLTELVASGERFAEFMWFLFDDSLLAEKVPLTDSPLERLHHFALYPCAQDVIGFLPDQVRRAYSGGFESLVQKLFFGAYQSGSIPIIKFLVNRVAIPRLKVRFFIEKLIFLEEPQWRLFYAHFPGGARGLSRELDRLRLPSVARLVAQRRRELRSALRYRKQGAYFASQPRSDVGGQHQSCPSSVKEEQKSAEKSARTNEEFASTAESFEDLSISGAPPFDEEEKEALMLVQREQVQEILKSNIIELPEMDVFKEMLLAA